MEYLDFDIEVGKGRGRSYPVKVLGSPAGEARAIMQLPFGEPDLQDRIRRLRYAVLHSSTAFRRIIGPEEEVVQEFGSKLFDALFSGDVRSALDTSLVEAGRQGRGLRLRIRCEAAHLAALPWEFLFDCRQADYLCLSVKTPLVRYLGLQRPVQPLKATQPLRVLGMIAAPSNLPGLDVDRECERIDQATRRLRERGILDLQWLEGQTYGDLQEALWSPTWHVFHFIGHGGFDPDMREGLVAFAGENARRCDVHATDLGRLLGDHPTLRLVVLNSCEGARSDPQDLFSSTAAVLVRKGVPAVVAMQYEISGQAALALAGSFYRAIATGMPVDSSLTEARKALAAVSTLEWGTPVLFMRSSQGTLFDFADTRLATPRCSTSTKNFRRTVPKTRSISPLPAG